MKRCSQCDFIFEDDQQVCDFDGTKLTYVPEHAPSFPNVPADLSTHKAVVPSPIRRLVRSPFSVAVLALLGVASSALLIGYFDSANQSNSDRTIDLASNAESRNNTVNPAPGDPSQNEAKPDQVSKPTMISTQRRITSRKSSSMLSSRLRLESEGSRSSRSSRRRQDPSISRLATSTSVRRSSKPRRTRRTGSEALARSHRPGNRADALARNQQRSGRNESESARQKTDNKLVAILKKTGRILKRPFDF